MPPVRPCSLLDRSKPLVFCLATSGCTLLAGGIKGPPPPNEAYTEANCPTKRAAPVVDLILGGLLVVGGAGPRNDSGQPRSTSTRITYGAVGAAFAGVGVWGLWQAERCGRLVREQQERSAVLKRQEITATFTPPPAPTGDPWLSQGAPPEGWPKGAPAPAPTNADAGAPDAEAPR
jgi:hypothetical protein